jgi:anaerobic ribonucleoside-triphosphate reductase activating protein
VPERIVNVHTILDRSHANGPGLRTVIWFQGCTLGCPGCFNPATHPHVPRLQLPVTDLLARIARNVPEIEGVTISGGEPLQQPEGLLNLLAGIRASTTLSVILFSGHTREEIGRLAQGGRVLASIDVLIAGRYEAAHHWGRGLRGSSNQEIHLLTPRYRVDEIERTPPLECRIDRKGTIVVTGIRPL